MEDLRAVLDAAGASNAVVFGSHKGSCMAALYAATYPERTRALALFHPLVRWAGAAALSRLETTTRVGEGGDGGFGFRLSQRGALRGSMRQAASDGVDGDTFVRRIGAAGPVELRHACAACVVQADQSPFVVGNRAAGAAALGR